MSEEVQAILEQYLTFTTLAALRNTLPENMPEEGLEITLQISPEGELNGIDVD